MRCDIKYKDQCVGYLTAERRGLYYIFYGETNIRTLSRIAADFNGGTFTLGIPVPEGEKMVLRKSLPVARLPKGQLLGARLLTDEEQWKIYNGGVFKGISLPSGETKDGVIRYPWNPGKPMPVHEIMLFCSYGTEGGRGYLYFDPNEITQS